MINKVVKTIKGEQLRYKVMLYSPEVRYVYRENKKEAIKFSKDCIFRTKTRADVIDTKTGKIVYSVLKI